MLKTSSCNESAIDKLTDDCLIHIFQYLPIIDRIRAESVSKRWQELVQQSWISFKHFTFHKKTWTHLKTRHLKKALVTIDDKIFESLLFRFGRYLISIDLNCEFSVIQHKLTPSSIEQICQFCRKLETLNLGHMFLSVPKCEGKSVEADDCECEPGLLQIIQALSHWKHISKLKKFGLEVLHGKADNISALISKMKSLESLYMGFEIYYFIEGSYLSGLPFNTLREVIFEECNAIDETILARAVQSIAEPHTLILMELPNCNLMHNLSSLQNKSLKNLVLGGYCRLGEENFSREVEIFRNFNNLERLNLSHIESLVKDELLLALGKYCKRLKFLDISASKHVTDEGIKHVVSLPKLKYLFMKSLPQVSGKTLKKMDNLQVLECYNCINLEDEGLCNTIQESKIQLLNVSKSSKVTDQLFDTVVKELSTRKNKLNMIFIIEETNIVVKEAEKLPPLLHIAGSYEFYNSSFNKMRDFFPKIGPFGIKPIYCTGAEYIWRMSDGSLGNLNSLRI